MTGLAEFFSDKSVLITGGTGTLGMALVKRLLEFSSLKRIIVLSRDEMKQWHMQEELGRNDLLRFFIGDVRDYRRLSRAFEGVDHVVHAAATKIVPVSEYNPHETVKTNVFGAMNVIDAAINCSVKSVVGLSTDKASAPINLYGASKLVSDKLLLASRVYSSAKTSFSVVRYGNVVASRGSIIPLLQKQFSETGRVRLTDPRMTRFMLTRERAVDFVLESMSTEFSGEMRILKSPSMSLAEIAEAVVPGAELEIVGLRPGEKIHEQMIGPDDVPFAIESDRTFSIAGSIGHRNKLIQAGRGVALDEGFRYSSDRNNERMSVEELRLYLEESRHSELGQVR